MYLPWNFVPESLGDDSSPTSAVILLGLLVVLAVQIWMGVAVEVKRWHDRDKAGYWVLINFIPLLGPIWSFIELGFLKGTDGPNRYGDQPDTRGYGRPRVQLSGQH